MKILVINGPNINMLGIREPGIYGKNTFADLLKLLEDAIPAVEVHISDVDAREPFRQISYAGMACVKTIKGQGLDGYRQAILYLKRNYE